MPATSPNSSEPECRGSTPTPAHPPECHAHSRSARLDTNASSPARKPRPQPFRTARTPTPVPRSQATPSAVSCRPTSNASPPFPSHALSRFMRAGIQRQYYASKWPRWGLEGERSGASRGCWQGAAARLASAIRKSPSQRSPAPARRIAPPPSNPHLGHKKSPRGVAGASRDVARCFLGQILRVCFCFVHKHDDSGAADVFFDQRGRHPRASARHGGRRIQLPCRT